MGLDTTHDCWHGAYSAFMRWRQEIARVAGLPPLELMEGFWDINGGGLNPLYWQIQHDKEAGYDHRGQIWYRLPIKWDCLKPSALHLLLHHSDCEGEIRWEDCSPIADALEELLPKFPDGEGGGHIGNWRDKTATFILGLRQASSLKENVVFH